MTVKVWYDHKRQCYVSNAAFVLAKLTNLDPMTCAKALKTWVETNHPEMFEK